MQVGARVAGAERARQKGELEDRMGTRKKRKKKEGKKREEEKMEEEEEEEKQRVS